MSRALSAAISAAGAIVIVAIAGVGSVWFASESHLASFARPAAFAHLMRSGKALGKRELPMMSGVVRSRFVHFTDDEVRDLYSFLSDLAARAAAAR